MKAIMISIKPKWVAKILNGEKTIEIRKTCPALFKGWDKNDSLKYGCGFDVYIYCTKSGPYLHQITDPFTKKKTYVLDSSKRYMSWNGKVVAKFTLKHIDNLSNHFTTPYLYTKETCLTWEEILNYRNNGLCYAWHIDNLVIFDRPKELSEFKRVKWSKCGVKDKNGLYQCHKCPYGEELNYGGICHYGSLTRSPESWCYVEVE